MTTALASRQRSPSKSIRQNKGLIINEFLSKYTIKFEIGNDAIDLREMSKNYQPHGIIPLEDIHQAILVCIKPSSKNIQKEPYDPSSGCTIVYPGNGPLLKFQYVEWDSLYLWPIFQRDVAPNHIEKILPNFDHTAISIPCAIKITINGKVYFILWDGHHTVQLCKLMNYVKFPVWYIDVDIIPDSDIEKAGFNTSIMDKIQYGCYIAGRNMRWINGIYKKELNTYDDFMIGLETKDAEIVAIMNILKKNNCFPSRKSKAAGSLTQIKAGYECFGLADIYGNKGKFFDRAVAFHRRVWPGSALTLEVFRPLSYLYHKSETQGIALDQQFDKELEDLLVSKYGDSESVQESIKESYWKSYFEKLGTGVPPDRDQFRVLNGLINLYNQNVGRITLPPAEYVWKV